MIQKILKFVINRQIKRPYSSSIQPRSCKKVCCSFSSIAKFVGLCGLEFDRSNPVVLDMTTWLRPIPSFEESISPCSITLIWKVYMLICALSIQGLISLNLVHTGWTKFSSKLSTPAMIVLSHCALQVGCLEKQATGSNYSTQLCSTRQNFKFARMHCYVTKACVELNRCELRH